MRPISELVGQSWLIYQKHFYLLIGYAAWPLLPYVGLVLVSLPQPNIFFEGLSSVCLLAQSFLALWVGIIIPLIIRELTEKKKKIMLPNLQNKAWQLMLSVVFVAILETAVLLGGFILLIIPAFIFWVWFAMAQLSVILDNKKGLSALIWSRELARGKFFALAWRLIAGPLFILAVIISLAGLITLSIAAINQTPISVVFGPTPPLWADLISTVIETFSIPLFLIYFTLLYLDLTKPTLEDPEASRLSIPQGDFEADRRSRRV